MMISSRIRSASLSLCLVYSFLFLPLVYPFVSGTTTSATARQPLVRPPSSSSSHSTKESAVNGYLSPKPLATQIDSTIPSQSDKPQSRWRRIFSRNSQHKEATTTPRQLDKAAERNASILSRMLFTYATPLLKTASERHLEEEDAYDFAENKKMEASVSSLASIHKQVRQKTYEKNLQKQRVHGHKQQLSHDEKVSQEAIILTKSLFVHQRRMLLYTAVLRFLNTAVQAFPALLVSRLLKLVEQGAEVPPSRAFTAALTLVGVLSVKMITENQYFHNIVKCATNVRGSLSGMIFDKALTLPGGGSGVTHPTDGKLAPAKSGQESKNSKSRAIGSGGVLNLMQSDTSIIESATLQVHTTWDGLLQLSMYTYLLYRFLGKPVFYGVAVLVGTIPVNSITLRILNRLTKYENEAKDARTKRTAESIGNMKLLKLFGWEESFSKDIRDHRKEELRRHIARGVVKAVSSAISNAVPALVLVVTLRAYAKAGNPIAASTIFTAISLFNQLRFPLWFYPMLIDSLANGRNAMRRISNFLAAEEIVDYVQRTPLVNGEGGSIEMKHGNFLWSVSESTSSGKNNEDSDGLEEEKNADELSAPALAGVNVSVGPGEVVAVVGSVGSGKTALIKGLLGELNPVPGPIMEELLGRNHQREATSGLGGSSVSSNHINQRPLVAMRGEVAYCSQEAWLPKGTIRDAIVFGREYDEERYLSAVRDAGLDKDIVSNGNSDSREGQLRHDTDVGEHGASLSGGQRARVALARALYSGNETKVFLLDDCLAALDASVGSTVFERLTARLRAQDAAVVMVTNDPSIPRRCDRTILVGKVGSSKSCSTIVDSGSYDELLAKGYDLSRISISEAKSQKGKKISSGSTSSTHSSIPGTTGVPVDDIDQVDEDEYVYDAPKLMKLDKERIHVFGNPSNGTSFGCHADPESQLSMENCPDSMYDRHSIADSASVHEPESIFAIDSTGCFNSLNATGDGPAVNCGPDTPQKAEPKTVVSADDSMSSDAVPLSIFTSYFRSVRNPALIVLMMVSFVTVNSAQLFQQYTVARWSEVAKGDAMAGTLGSQYMQSLVNAAGIVSVFLWLRSFLCMKVGVRASEFLHSKMLSSVFKAPLSFFDSTSSGQLLSRFGKEMEIVDNAVPDSIQSTLFCFLQIFMSMGALASIVTPGMLVPLSLVSFLYVKTMAMFRPAARDLKRSETKTRSPIYTHFGEALRGAETIRSVPGAKRLWSSAHRSLTDTNLGVFYTVKSIDRWLSTRLETLGNLVVFTAAVASVLLARVGRLQAGSAGWGLTQSLSITGLLTWAVRCLTDLESNMLSVQRVKELTNVDAEQADLESSTVRRIMPREQAKAGEALQPLLKKQVDFSLAPLENGALSSSGWPWRGNIRFRNVSMRYSPSSPLVLQNVNLNIPAGSSLGVVGRTGSGKSSLLLTLFRLMEIEPNGSIEIDGVDTRALKLETLRRSLAIIPQDPTLFQGSIRYNLDAMGGSNDADMWKALETASPSLAKQFREDEGLDSQISEGGKNLSQGQRQLMCLARALLRKSKILVMDEATSSVDSVTDQAVQQTIRREFVDKGVTVITVAHRLDTVLGYDNIAVLGAGSVLEYGPPSRLLEDASGELRKLVYADLKSKKKGAAKRAPVVESASSAAA